MPRRPPRTTLFPYTTLFRSREIAHDRREIAQDLAEIRGDKQEIKKDRQELRGDLRQVRERSEEHTSELQSRGNLVYSLLVKKTLQRDRQEFLKDRRDLYSDKQD